jgi:hypothetical protein
VTGDAAIATVAAAVLAWPGGHHRQRRADGRLSAAYQRDIIDAVDVLAPDGRYLQYTFTLGSSPVRARRLGLTGRRLGDVRQLPPSVCRHTGRSSTTLVSPSD